MKMSPGNLLEIIPADLLDTLSKCAECPSEPCGSTDTMWMANCNPETDCNKSQL